MSAGVVIVLFGAYLLYFEADLNRWISIGLLTAGILLFVGVCVMMFAGGARSDPPEAARPTSVIQDNRPVVRHEPR